jgi:hypothetical protein
VGFEVSQAKNRILGFLGRMMYEMGVIGGKEVDSYGMRKHFNREMKISKRQIYLD